MQAGGARQTFYQQIAHNKRRSLLLVLVIAAILVVLGYAVGLYLTGEVTTALVAIPGALALTGVLSLGALYGGDGLVLAASRAREVSEDEAPELVHVVRELAIAANIPPPRVYIIDDTAPNAFATGRDPRHASVAITSGLLQKLNREELQGVLGHELSHVRNYDIRFTLLVGVLVGSIALLADFFLRMSFWRGVSGGRRGRGGGGGLVALGYVIALILALLAPFFTRLVQMAVSRQREYLADASSVELTRNPYGLERALAKIALDQEPLEVANRATQHLYIVNPIKKLDESRRGLFSTHPPLLDRINRLRQISGQPPVDSTSAAALAGLD
jgi:heat shock protein HtpX